MNWLVVALLVVAIAAAYFIGGRKLGASGKAGGAKAGGAKAGGAKGGARKKGPGLRVVGAAAPRANGAAGGSLDERGQPCPWKMRAKARGDFEARWRCGRCGADISWPEGAPPDRCRRVRAP